MDKHNCWDYCECGRQPGGEHVDELGVCPAAVDKSADGLNDGQNGGRICWALTGTFCGGEPQGTFAEKHHSCLSCGFLKMVKLEQGRAFLLMLPGQIYKPHSGFKAG